jgi:general secretion pathway protein H
MIGGAVLSVHVAGSDSDLEKERTRMVAILDYMRDQATLQSREYGIRCFEGGYEFLVYDAREDVWLRLEDDSLTQARKLPVGIEMSLLVEGQKIVLPPAKIKDEDRKPQILLFSSGEMNLFELSLHREGGAGVSFKPGSASDTIEVADLAAQAG